MQEGAELVAVDEDTVILRRSENLSYEEAYPTLSQEQKRFADDIIAYAVSKEDGLKDQVGGRYASVYIGKKPPFVRRDKTAVSVRYVRPGKRPLPPPENFNDDRLPRMTVRADFPCANPVAVQGAVQIACGNIIIAAVMQ